ncbi:hypothetical protein N9N28_14940 [Rubripirellula amarantea]|nr:hypothetical protein [Rubripirellula amarantea]
MNYRPDHRILITVCAAFFSGIVVGLAWFLWSSGFGQPLLGTSSANSRVPIAAGVDLDEGFDPSIADPTLTPGEVVSKQLRSLKDAETNPKSLKVCYSLASPGNRSITGPIGRFADLFRDGPYFPLVGHQDAMIGRASIDGDEALVLATIVAKDGQTHAFTFRLSRQVAADLNGAAIADNGQTDAAKPAGGCWMTDGVLPVLPITEPNKHDATQAPDEGK